MRRVKLDRIDRRILRYLQANGRITNVELARRVGISAPPCLRRVRALEKAGFIRGYHADIHQEQLGYGVTTGEQYYFPGCTSSVQCVLPNATIPQSAWSAPAKALLKYIPAPTVGSGEFSTSAYNQILNDDKIGERQMVAQQELASSQLIVQQLG